MISQTTPIFAASSKTCSSRWGLTMTMCDWTILKYPQSNSSIPAQIGNQEQATLEQRADAAKGPNPQHNVENADLAGPSESQHCVQQRQSIEAVATTDIPTGKAIPTAASSSATGGKKDVSISMGQRLL